MENILRNNIKKNATTLVHDFPISYYAITDVL